MLLLLLVIIVIIIIVVSFRLFYDGVAGFFAAGLAIPGTVAILNEDIPWL